MNNRAVILAIVLAGMGVPLAAQSPVVSYLSVAVWSITHSFTIQLRVRWARLGPSPCGSCRAPANAEDLPWDWGRVVVA